MRLPRFLLALLLMAAVFFTCWLVWAALFATTSSGTFHPRLPDPTPVGLVNPQPIPLSFADLNADPYGWRNRLLRVSGSFTLLPRVNCLPFKGVQPRWALVNEGLKMDIVGLNELTSIALEGGPITVEGVWRLYEGPLGCGKEPERGVVWYLEAKRLVAPNPLVFDPNSTLELVVWRNIGSSAVAPNPTQEVPSEPTLRVEEGDDVLEPPTPTPTLTPTPTSSAGNNSGGNPTAVPSPTATARSGIPTPGSGGGSGVPAPGGNGEEGGGSGGGTTPPPTTPPPSGTAVPSTPIPTSPPTGYGGNNPTTVPNTPMPTVPSTGYD